VITVSGLQFEALAQDKKTQEMIAKRNEKETLMEYFAVKLGPSLVVLILGIFVILLLKSVLSKLPQYDVSYRNNLLGADDDIDITDGLDENSIRILEQGDNLPLDFSNAETTLQDIEISKQEQSINTLNEAILSDPEAAAKVLMSYIKD